MFQTEIHPWHVLLASCRWGRVTAHGVGVLPEMYVIYTETYTSHRTIVQVHHCPGGPRLSGMQQYHGDLLIRVQLYAFLGLHLRIVMKEEHLLNTALIEFSNRTRKEIASNLARKSCSSD